MKPVRSRLSFLVLIALVSISTSISMSQLRAAQVAIETRDHTFDRLLFRNIGPANMGGRVSDLAVSEKHPTTFFAGVATGGLWKTVNNGTTWEPVFDNQDVASIGAVATLADNASLVWVGTGEANKLRHKEKGPPSLLAQTGW